MLYVPPMQTPPAQPVFPGVAQTRFPPAAPQAAGDLHTMVVEGPGTWVLAQQTSPTVGQSSESRQQPDMAGHVPSDVQPGGADT